MGVCFEVVCDKCKVKRDIDKIKLEKCANGDEAEEYAKRLENSNPYREALLLSFIAEHKYCGGVRIVNDGCGCDENNAEDGYKSDGNNTFWN